MPVFIADHTGSIGIQSPNLRPVHIGAGLIQDGTIGPEPDTQAAGSLSKHTVYADLRLYHHVRHVYDGRASHVAIQQYRRMFFPGRPLPWQRSLKNLGAETLSLTEAETTVDFDLRGAYLTHLSRQSDRVLRQEIGDADFLANRMTFGAKGKTVERQYTGAIKVLYPHQSEYVDAWYDLREILERMTSTDVVAHCFDGQTGYFNNCFVSSWKSFVRYYEFLFEALDGLKQYNQVFRLFGYLAERVFGVFLWHTSARVTSRAMMKFV